MYIDHMHPREARNLILWVACVLPYVVVPEDLDGNLRGPQFDTVGC